MSDLNLKDRNLRMALLKAYADWCAEMIKAERALHQAELAARYKDEGTKSFDVKLPNNVKVAGISLSVPSASTEVVDEDALLKWAQVNAPDLVTEITIPGTPAQFVAAHTIEAVPDRVEYELNSKRVTELLAGVKPVDPTGGPVVRVDDGALVDGVEYSPEGDPSSFSVRFTPEGRDAVVFAYKDGLLSHLVAGTPLPAIAGPETDQ